MAAEGLNNAIKYLFIMTTIVTIFITIGSLIKLNQLVGNLASYIEDNIPEHLDDKFTRIKNKMKEA